MRDSARDPRSEVVVEGLTRTALLTYLAPFTLPESELMHSLSLLKFGGGRECFALIDPSSKDRNRSGECCLLVNGTSRTLSIRQRTSPNTFQATHVPLTFFVKPGYAPTTTLRVERKLSKSAFGEKVLLRRDAAYQYGLNGHWVQLLSSTSEHVQLETVGAFAQERSYLAATSFWSFVFGSYGKDLECAEISPEHVAALLGLNRKKTLERHIGTGHLPTTRTTSRHPGITLAGLVEFLAYRQQFPQGHPNNAVVEAWRDEWRKTHSQFVPLSPS